MCESDDCLETACLVTAASSIIITLETDLEYTEAEVGSMLASALLMACFGVRYYRTKDTQGKSALVWKGSATAMAVLAALYCTVKNPGLSSVLILAGTVLCMIADVLLELWFLAGVASFGTAHLCFIAGFYEAGDYKSYTPFVFVVLLAAMLLIFAGFFKEMKELVLPGVMYGIVLCAMTSLAVTAAVSQGNVSGLLRGLGGLCFFISDNILGWSTLKGVREKGYGAAVLLLYFPAVYLLALSIL